MPNHPLTVRVNCARQADCIALAKRLDVDLLAPDQPHTQGVLLEYKNGTLQLVEADERSAPLCIELSQRKPGRGADPLLRAIGYKTESVIDCTAGWCTDASHIAGQGISVVAIEQHPVVFELISDALSRCTDEQIKQHLKIVHANAVNWLNTHNPSAEVIYLDPMYPPKPGSALPKKPLQLLHNLTTSMVQHDVALLQKASNFASRRVVVKRPHYSPPILPGKSGEIRAKLVRFDLYPPKFHSSSGS